MMEPGRIGPLRSAKPVAHQRGGKANRNSMEHPPRVAWVEFPNTVILVGEPVVKGYPEYARAKSGDAGAARALVADLVGPGGLDAVESLLIDILGETGSPDLVNVDAHERQGANAVPSTLAALLGHGLACHPKPGLFRRTSLLILVRAVMAASLDRPGSEVNYSLSAITFWWTISSVRAAPSLTCEAGSTTLQAMQLVPLCSLARPTRLG